MWFTLHGVQDDFLVSFEIPRLSFRGAIGSPVIRKFMTMDEWIFAFNGTEPVAVS
jgi:hypothetical protein